MPSPASRLGALRRLPRDPASFYAITDLDTALRLGGGLWVFGALIVAILLPVSPPSDEVSAGTGWLLGGIVVGVCLASAVPLLAVPHRVSPNALMALGYASLALIATLQWAGGLHSPWVEPMIICVIYFSAVHPPRRVAAFMVAVAGVLALPFAYDGWSSAYAAQALAHYLLWGTLSAATVAFTCQVRVARLELREDEQEASELARRDPLTGLGNRRAFDEALERVVAGARRADRPLSLVVADIATFKSVNDAHGHLAGDRCLRAVAAAIAGSIRPTDRAFRWGGDEFAVLLPSTDLHQAQVATARIARAVAHDAPLPDGEPMALRYGVAEIEPGMDARELMAAADADLMAAKTAAAQTAQ